jgi:hypothetical protein
MYKVVFINESICIMGIEEGYVIGIYGDGGFQINPHIPPHFLYKNMCFYEPWAISFGGLYVLHSSQRIYCVIHGKNDELCHLIKGQMKVWLCVLRYEKDISWYDGVHYVGYIWIDDVFGYDYTNGIVEKN